MTVKLHLTTPHFDRVSRFMVLAGQATPDVPTQPSPAMLELRIKLLMEEVLETAKAAGVQVGLRVTRAELAASNLADTTTVTVLLTDEKALTFHSVGGFDMVEYVDGLADVSVITTGGFVGAGVGDDPILKEVDNNNLAKFGPGGYRRPDGKWVKPTDHKPPNITARLVEQGWVAP